MDGVRVLGIPLYVGDMSSLLQAVEERYLGSERPVMVSATSVHGVVEAHFRSSFRRILDAFHFNVADGLPLVRWGRRLGSEAKGLEQIRGVALMKTLCTSEFGRRETHFLCGGKTDLLTKLKTVCETEWEVEKTIETYSPPFISVYDYDYQSIAKRIRDAQSRIVWIGLGTPKQEAFAARLADSLGQYPCILCTVGAAFSIHAKIKKQAPLWMQKNGLEWLHRLIQSPKRLWKRYLLIIPLFFYLCAKELIKK